MSDQARLTIFGKLVALLLVAGCIAGAYLLFARSGRGGGAANPGSGTPGSGAAASAGRTDPPTDAPSRADGGVEIGVAYGSEKERWFAWAVEEFARTTPGRGVKINLKKMGSIEGAMAVLKEDRAIHVWSPASALYRHNLVDDWRLNHAGSSEDPILKEEALALTPMVFVMWEERYQAFTAGLGKDTGLNFRSIEQAIRAKGGWSEIAPPPGKPEWGFFKFAHTHPNQSNSGLMTLVLMAYDFHDKTAGLGMADITSPAFQTWATGLQRGVSGLANSTGNLMKEMVQRGPSTYDAVFVYENTAIDYLANAEGRWGRIRVVYPDKNAWNDNPYYILNVPWSTRAQRDAAQAFLDFLMSEPSQRKALEHGFRPGNVAVPINGPDSPFTRYKDYGLRVDLPSVCQTPSGEVIRNLLIRWQQTRGG